MTTRLSFGGLGSAKLASVTYVDKGDHVALTLSGRDAKGRAVTVTRIRVPLAGYAKSPSQALSRPEPTAYDRRRFVKRVVKAMRNGNHIGASTQSQ